MIRLRPFGILPNNARIRVIVEEQFEDLSGESNVGSALYNRVFAEFDTADSYDVGFDALVENFVSAESIDFTAGFVEPLAEVVPGALRANFDFEGSRTNLRYEPTSQEVVLNTDFTQIQPSNGQAINVVNGIFMFRDVVIPAGVTVRGVGTNPMVWLVTGDFEVSGRLLVVGGDGQRVDTLNSANFPTGGGVGNCGGGSGGQAGGGRRGSGRRGGGGAEGGAPVAYRWRLNLKTGKTTEGALDEFDCEFPRVDDRLAGAKTRYGYGLSSGTALVKFDFVKDRNERHDFGKGRETGEGVFVPGKDGKDEDDGYLISFVYDHAERRSEMAIIDCRDFKKAVVARVLIPQRVPNGFHGMWLDDDVL